MIRAAAWSSVIVVLASAYAFGAVEPLWSVALAALLLLVTAATLARESLAGTREEALPRGLAAVLVACALLPFVTLVPVGAAVRELLSPGAAALLREIGVDGARPLSLDPGATFRAGLLAAAAAGTAYVVFRAARGGPLLGLRSALVVAGVLLASFGLVQRLTSHDPSRIYWSIPLAEVGTPFGPYVNRNHFAGAMELLAPAAAGLALHLGASGRKGAARLTWLAVGLMATALLATASRGGALGGAAAALLLVVSCGGLRRPRVLLSIAASVALLIALLTVLGFGRELLPRFVTAPWSERWENRFLVQRDALSVFLGNPWFGTGAGSFGTAYVPFQTIDDARHFGDAHSDWAQFLMELGLLGALAAAAVAALVVRPLRAALRAPLAERALVFGPLAGCAAILVHGCVDVNLHVPANALLTIVVLSLAYGAASAAGLQRSPEIADEQMGSGPHGSGPGLP